MSRVLEEPARAVIEAALARLMPAYRSAAGAREADAMTYVERLTADPDIVAPLTARLARGVDMLEGLARSRFERGFVDCDADQQDQALAALQAIPHARVQQSFTTLLNLAIAGFLCHPRNGGNRDRVGWTAIGYTPRSPAIEPEPEVP